MIDAQNNYARQKHIKKSNLRWYGNEPCREAVEFKRKVSKQKLGT